MAGPNCWVIVAASDEVGDGLFARTAWGQRLVMYRTAVGEVALLTDRCSHRQFPLSLGCRAGDDVVCGYHGFRFGPDGTCLEIPTQSLVPSRAAVDAFPTIDAGGWVWVWLGEETPSAFDAPDVLAGDVWRSAGGASVIDAPALLLVENLHDLSHIPFVHPTTIGSSAFAERTFGRDGDGRVLRTTREWPDVDCPPMYQRSAGLSSPVDRVIDTTFFVPSLAVVDSQIRPAGAPPEFSKRVVHEIAVVPATDESVHYLWRSSWNFALDDDAVADVLGTSEQQVIAEDKFVLEAQWESIRAAGGAPPEISVKSDAGSLQARRAFQYVLAEGRLPDPRSERAV